MNYDERIKHLYRQKLQFTEEKRQAIGYIDSDDSGMILPPPEKRRKIETISSSGMPVTDMIFPDFQPVSASGEGFFGLRECGENYERLLKMHPVFVDRASGLAGAFMTNFNSYRKTQWNPKHPYTELMPVLEKYQLVHAIGASQHFCQDFTIGLELGFGGLKEKLLKYQQVNRDTEKQQDFYEGCLAVIRGMQDWIGRTAEECKKKSLEESDSELKENLEQLYRINTRLVSQPPETFREACQWILWYQLGARMYNGSGSLGRLDIYLQPYYEKDRAAGCLDDEEAVYYLASMLVRDTGYIQIGGYGPDGKDNTNRLSYLILEAAHRLKIPSNIGLAIGEGIDRNLLRRGVEIQFGDKCGNPRFVGVDSLIQGFMKNGYDYGTAAGRINAGCHWMSIPGREYSLQDCIKINLATILDVAIHDVRDSEPDPDMNVIWAYFEKHLRAAVAGIAASIDIQYKHMYDTFPELFLDLLCYGPVEKGIDASNGGLEYYNFGVDASALAVVADSLAAMEEMVFEKGRYSFAEMVELLDADWSGPEGEKARQYFSNCGKYGQGVSAADRYAVKLSQCFTQEITRAATPDGHRMIPGIFSWANTIPMGKILGASPNGRKAQEPISHGANPNPGFREDGAATAISCAIASVQPGFGNTAPMQLELEPGVAKEEGGVELIAELLADHCRRGGTLINLNILNAEKILEANENPEKYPDLIVRVTGFSAYFASLSPQFRQLVVDRVVRTL
ncbi:pyruvate formate lyase family protein [Clostridium sp. D5]|uniref:pyruvate formate lyase family protein n=1 Tax=Clostridium sp. D5 TaxID=556261 RepID=UPI0001FC78F0|nr:pyruvate formate lyase family protein [Clostridium sp. D5]EGB94182.1 formate acetyltransferase 2 [Clostridium sp. D5]